MREELLNPDAREHPEIRVVPYEARFQPVFKKLNADWICEHWEIEPHDSEVLDFPQENVIDRGGEIFVALCAGVPVGVCALYKSEDAEYDFELTKLAVDPAARGKNIGKILCETAIERARERGAKKIFLESNTALKPAISLYRKMGFREVSDYRPIYARANIKMELPLAR